VNFLFNNGDGVFGGFGEVAGFVVGDGVDAISAGAGGVGPGDFIAISSGGA